MRSLTNRKVYIYRFFFFDENQKIYDIKEEREVTDEFYAASYAFDWLYKFEYKYGKCVKILVTDSTDPHNVLLNIKRTLKGGSK